MDLSVDMNLKVFLPFQICFALLISMAITISKSSGLSNGQTLIKSFKIDANDLKHLRKQLDAYDTELTWRYMDFCLEKLEKMISELNEKEKSMKSLLEKINELIKM